MKINIGVSDARIVVTNDDGEVIASGGVSNYQVTIEATKLGQAIGTLMRTIEMDKVTDEIKRAAAAAQATEG